MKPRKLSRTVIYKSPWVNLFVDKVKLPGGKIIEKYHILDFEKEAVAVIVENAAKEVLLIQSYRYPTNTIEWEIPAGNVEEGESVIDAAKRETFEETGYKTSDIELVYTYNPMNGITNKVFHVVRCIASKNVGKFDKNEVKELKWFSIDRVKKMIEKNIIRDGFSLTSLLLLLLKKGQKSITGPAVHGKCLFPRKVTT